jgi:hypothetical protein
MTLRFEHNLSVSLQMARAFWLAVKEETGKRPPEVFPSRFVVGSASRGVEAIAVRRPGATVCGEAYRLRCH